MFLHKETKRGVTTVKLRFKCLNCYRTVIDCALHRGFSEITFETHIENRNVKLEDENLKNKEALKQELVS